MQAVTNAHFLEAVFDKVEGSLWICSFSESPNTNKMWGGKAYHPKHPLRLAKSNNNYFSVAELVAPRRIASNFSRMAVLVLDDADTSKLVVKPSYILKTSPGKFQVGFILNDTKEARDEKFCAASLKLLANNGHIPADKSGNNIVRYVRLPNGSNTKDRKGGSFANELTLWKPTRKYNLPEVLQALGIDVSAKPNEKNILSLEEPLNIQQAIEDIITGASFHDSLIRLAAHFVVRSMPSEDIEATLYALMNASKAKTSDAKRWKERYDSIPQAVSSAVVKYGTEFSDLRPITAPEPLNLFPELNIIPEWSACDYPKVIADLAVDISYRMGVDPIIPAWTAISVASALISDRYNIQVKAHDYKWCEASRLWIALVGDPASKKTPAMNEVLAPLKQLQVAWHQEYRLEYENWELQCTIARKEKNHEPPKPHPRKVYVNDTTIEALSDILEHNRDGILSLHDELTSWFGSMDCYRSNGTSKDRPTWLIAYQGGPHFIDRVSKGSRCISNFSVGILGGIQPDPMRRIASRLGDDDGLLQRFLLLPVKASGYGTDSSPDATAQKAWADLCSELSDLGGFEHIKFSSDAQVIIDDARRTLQGLGQNPTFDRRLQSALQKGEGQLARLALIFHMIENRKGKCPDTAANVPNEYISARTAQKVARLFLRFVIPNMILVYQEVIGDSEGMANARLAAGYILAQGKKVISERDLYRAHRQFRGQENQAILRGATSQLELAAWISPVIKNNGKPPTEWNVNPRVHIDFAELAKKERMRRTQEKMKIQEMAKMARLSLENQNKNKQL